MTDPPLRIHFVWTGAHFPYFARLAVESAMVAMPAARIDLNVVGELPVSPHLDAVTHRRQVHVEHWDAETLFTACPGGPAPYRRLLARIPEGSAAAVSNLARLAILFARGGVYLDTDVIVLRGLHDPDRHGAFVGVERVWAANRSRVCDGLGALGTLRAVPWAARWVACRLDASLTHGRLRMTDRLPATGHTRMQVNNAVIGSPSESDFLALALEQALTVDPEVRFALGPNLLDDVAATLPSSVHIIPPSRFYAVPPGESYRWFSDRTLELPPDAHVMHYVASNHRRLLSTLEPDDTRFETGTAQFWCHARRVRAALDAATPIGASR